MKSWDLQKTPGGTSWIALRPISSSPESMVLFSWVNPPNFPEWKRSIEKRWKIKTTTTTNTLPCSYPPHPLQKASNNKIAFPFRKFFSLNAQAFFLLINERFQYNFHFKRFSVSYCCSTNSDLAHSLRYLSKNPLTSPKVRLLLKLFTPTVFLDHLKRNYLTNICLVISWERLSLLLISPSKRTIALQSVN